MPLSAAIAAARRALEGTHPDDTQPLTQVLVDLGEATHGNAPPGGGTDGRHRSARRPRDRVRPAGAAPPDGRPAPLRGVARGAARSLLVTPWFAAGAGFVLAAALFVYAPHTELRFPLTAPDEIPCAAPGCGTHGHGHSAGQPAASTPGQRINHSAGHRRSSGRSSASAGLTFKFSVIWQSDGKFEALIRVSGPRVPDRWRLEFAMPGSQIDNVVGAQWQPSAHGDGGTASAWQESGSNDAGLGAGGGSGPEPTTGNDPRQFGAAINFWVIGSGQASTPATCRFNGAICTFS